MIFMVAAENYKNVASVTGSGSLENQRNSSDRNSITSWDHSASSLSTAILRFDLGSTRSIDALWLLGSNIKSYQLHTSPNGLPPYTQTHLDKTRTSEGDGVIFETFDTPILASNFVFQINGVFSTTQQIKVYETVFSRILLNISDFNDFPSNINRSTYTEGGSSYRLANGELATYTSLIRPKEQIHIEWKFLRKEVRDSLESIWLGPPVQPNLTLYPEPEDRPSEIYQVRWGGDKFDESLSGETVLQGFDITAEFIEI